MPTPAGRPPIQTPETEQALINPEMRLFGFAGRMQKRTAAEHADGQVAEMDALVQPDRTARRTGFRTKTALAAGVLLSSAAILVPGAAAGEDAASIDIEKAALAAFGNNAITRGADSFSSDVPTSLGFGSGRLLGTEAKVSQTTLTPKQIGRKIIHSMTTGYKYGNRKPDHLRLAQIKNGGHVGVLRGASNNLPWTHIATIDRVTKGVLTFVRFKAPNQTGRTQKRPLYYQDTLTKISERSKTTILAQDNKLDETDFGGDAISATANITKKKVWQKAQIKFRGLKGQIRSVKLGKKGEIKNIQRYK